MFASLGCIDWWNCLANYAESIESVHIVCERHSSNSWPHRPSSYYFELDREDEATAVEIVLEPKYPRNTKGRPLCDIDFVVLALACFSQNKSTDLCNSEHFA